MSKVLTEKPTTSEQVPYLAKISRRSFGRRAAAAFSPAALFGATVALPGKLAAEPNQDATSPGVSTANGNSEVEAKLANIIRKYGSRLSEEQRAHLRKILIYNQKMLESVRAFPLQNGDPPSSVLRVSFARKNADARRRTTLPRSNPSSKGARAEGKVR